jgi:hypothetical protein
MYEKLNTVFNEHDIYDKKCVLQFRTVPLARHIFSHGAVALARY